MDVLNSMFDAVVAWLAHGFSGFSAWEIVLYTLVTTHITIAGVTIFLHRAQAHRALDLHAIPSHFFRLWLWLGTGMVTKEFVAIHRKHHAKVETEEDPHSPQTRGLKKLLLEGVELYRAESRNKETMVKYGHGTPDDWLERNLYTRFSWQGVGVMLLIDLFLFGGIGATVWAVQMAWIPFWATGIINGIGHYWGYRNFESSDASRNVTVWGLIVGGEELHNNHHTYPHVGEVLGQAVRVRHRLGVHTRPRDAWPGDRSQDRSATQGRRRAPGGRRQDARGHHRQPLRGHGELCAKPAPGQPCRSGAPEDRRRPWRCRLGQHAPGTPLAATATPTRFRTR